MQYTIIEFDGGTSCNVPSKGYGLGYGSYKINDEPVQRLKFDVAMSSNAAEIRTLACAVESLHDRIKRPLYLIGDSQIALKWANIAASNRKLTKISKSASAEFLESIRLLFVALTGYEVRTMWQSRIFSVKTFGH